jgi:MFS transporter, OCT family, solute carrier family 22 (organic cation transporter), member 4/5
MQGKDPVEEHLWQCTNNADEKCKHAYKLESPNKEFCQLDPSSWVWTAPDESVVSDLGLVCDRFWMNELANSAFFMGFLFGAAIWGAASDRYGRRLPLLASLLVSGLATGFGGIVPNYLFFFVSRIVQGMPFLVELNCLASICSEAIQCLVPCSQTP